MKGKLMYVSKDQTLVKSWVVWYNEQPVGGNVAFVDSLPLHPADIHQIEADSKRFDNIEARIAANPHVEFAIEDYWETGLEGVVQVAKLVESETICEYSGLPAVSEYIGDETNEDKIERILDRAMNEDRLLAESHWEGCDGCDENDKYFWITGFMIGLNVGRGDLKEYFKQPKKD